jgi:hypothetical protein
MINYNEEYFNEQCYFLLERKDNDIILSYSVYDVISESNKNNSNKKKFNKSNEKQIKTTINKILKSKNKISKKDIEKELSDLSNNGELDEFIDSDGTMLSSKIPFLDMTLHPKKTMDQTINATRSPGFTFLYGRRRYYGENKDKNDDVLSEVDMTPTFGYEETEFKDLKDTTKTLGKMGITDPVNKLERARKFGKRRDTKVVKNKKGEKIIKNLNLFEKNTLDEIKKQKMIKMVEDILSKKDKGNSDVIPKDDPISKILIKNLESIKRLADKEGISINKLINILKKSE